MNDRSMQISPSIPVKEVTFQSLASAAAGTGADHQPLYYYPDLTERDTPLQAYRHVDFFSLYIMRYGRGVHMIEGAPYAIARGDVYVMGIGMTHYFTECDSLMADTLHFTPRIFDTSSLAALTKTPGFHSLFVDEALQQRREEAGRWLHLPPEAYAGVMQSLQELRSEWEVGTAEGAVIARGLFFRLLVHLARHFVQSGHQPSSAPAPSFAREMTISAAVQYLEENFSEPVRIADLAAKVFLSPDRFSEVFFAVMGRTPRDYLSHLRLERAKTLLMTADLNMTQIALTAGYGDASHFTRVFRAATGMTPTQYRREYKP